MDADVSYAASYHFLSFLFEIPVKHQMSIVRLITDAEAFSCSMCNSFEMLTIVQNHE